MKFYTYLIKVIYGCLQANCSMSEEKPKPMMVESGLLNTRQSMSLSTLLLYSETRSSKNASLAPLIWKREGLVL